MAMVAGREVPFLLMGFASPTCTDLLAKIH